MCKYYEILIYRWVAWFTIVVVRTCRLTQENIIVKMLLASVCAVIAVLGVAGIAKAIPIELTDIWYPTTSECAIMLLLGFSLIRVERFFRKVLQKKTW